MSAKNEKDGKAIRFEDALDKTGFGLYSYSVICVSGLISVSFIFVVYATTFIVPTSSCELETTSAQQGLAIAVPSIGGIIGTSLWGYLADTRGRRSMLLLALLLSATTNALASLSVNWIMLAAVQFITVFLATGKYTLAMTLVSESVPEAKRNAVVLLVNSIFLLAQGIMALIAIPIIRLSFSHYIPALGIHWNSWRTLLVIYSVPSLLSAAGLYFLQESPKFAFAMGDEDRALKILKKMYRINKGNKADEFKVTGIIKESSEVGEEPNGQFLMLFKTPLLRNTLLMVPLFIVIQLIVAVLVWLPVIANQFASLLATGEGSDLTLCGILDASFHAPEDPDAVPCSLNSTGLLIVFGVCAMHAVVNTFLSQIVGKVGNRYTATAVTAVTGLGGILVNLVPNGIASVFLLAIFTVGIIELGIYSAMAVALFPTHLRAMAMSFLMSVGYLASFGLVQLLNFMITVNCELIIYLYTSLFLGFGLYNYLNTALSGLAIIAMACLVYGSTIVVPSSACELGTSGSQRGILVAAPIVGLILGGPVWGYLGDTRGRRSMLLVSLISSSLVNALSALSVNWAMLMTLQFVASLLAAAQYTLSMTLLSECVPIGKRNLVVLLVSSLFMLSQGTMAVMAIPIIPLTFSHYVPALGIYWNSWRTLVMLYSLPSLVAAFCFYFMQESPKYALVKGDEPKALKILAAIHRVNHKKGEVLEIKGLLLEVSPRDLGLTAKDQLVPLFRAPLLKYTIIVSLLFTFQLTSSFVTWLPTIANRVIRMVEIGEAEGMTICEILNADIEMPVDPNAVPCALNTTSLLLVLLVGVTQSVINAFLTIVVVNRAGRRNTAMAVAAVVGFCGIMVNLVPNTIGTSVFFGGFLMGMMVMGLYTAMTVALFPTHVRAMAVALTMTAGRMSSVAGIQIINFLLFTNCELGFYLFAAMIASSAIIGSFLPDDRFLQKSPPKEQQS